MTELTFRPKMMARCLAVALATTCTIAAQSNTTSWTTPTPAEVDDAIRFAQGVDGPALVWFEIAEEQNVFPMMPAGKGLSDLIEQWGGAEE